MTTTTLNDIARQAGVSPQTVARVLSGTNKENRPSSIERAQKIRELARQLNYRPNAAARAMNNRQTQNIGVLVAARAARKVFNCACSRRRSRRLGRNRLKVAISGV